MGWFEHKKGLGCCTEAFLMFSISILAGGWKLMRQKGGRKKSFCMYRLPDFWVVLGLDMGFWLRKRQNNVRVATATASVSANASGAVALGRVLVEKRVSPLRDGR
jgi:hypothetical protein